MLEVLALHVNHIQLPCHKCMLSRQYYKANGLFLVKLFGLTYKLAGPR